MVGAARDIAHGDAWLHALPRPAVVLDTRGQVVALNPAAATGLGLETSDAAGQAFADLAFTEDDRGGFEQVLGMVLAGRAWDGLLRVDGAGGPRLMRAQAAPVREGSPVGSPVSEPAAGLPLAPVVGVMLTLDAAGPAGDRAHEFSERLTRLTRVAAELQSANNLEALTEVVITHMADAAGATTSSLAVLADDDTLALAGVRQGVANAWTRWATFPVDESTPAGSAVLSRQPLLLTGRAAIERAYPDLELAAPGERSLLVLPLVVGERAVGVATLSFPSRVELDDPELEFYRVMADTCAQALERIRAQERLTEQHAKLSFLVEASTELASSLDYESTLKNVAWLAIPDLADWCAISLEQDGILRTLAVAHSDPDKVALALEFQERYPPDPDAEIGSYEVLRSGKSQLLPEVPDELLVEVAVDETHLEMIRSLNLRSALTVPLKARGRTFGTITWVNGEEGRRFGPEDVAFGEDLARRAAIAIDNALLHSELREVADRLQQAVLPPELPALGAWELGAAYSSAGHASVGGDFYDAIALPDERLALVIGDVMGRGVEAAAAMTQVRAAVRAFVAVDPEPERVLERLDLLYERFPSEQLVTLLYAVADPGADEVVLMAAGHPAPVVVDADGSARLIDTVRGRILGVGPTDRRRTVVPLGPGQTLLMYTDGLLERRAEDAQISEERLVAACRDLRPGPAAADLDRLIQLMRDPTRDDDVAVLAARRTAR